MRRAARKSIKRRVRRKWHYIQRPAAFCIGPCKCGNSDLQWSEWQKHVWCDKCKLDFIPTHNGVFDGPIPLNLANMMGIRFDRWDMKKKTIIRQEDYLKSDDA